MDDSMEIRICHVTAKEAFRYRDSFPENVKDHIEIPGYYVLAAVGDTPRPVGVGMYYLGILTDGTCYGRICDVTVDEAYRQQGAGEALMDKILELFHEAGVAESYVYVPKEDMTMAAFYKKYGYVFDVSTTEYHTTLGDMLREDYGKKKNLIATESIASLEEAAFSRLLRVIMEKAETDDPEAASSAELERELEAYDAMLSCFYRIHNGAGIFLVRRSDTTLEPVYLRGYGREVSDNLFELLLYSARIAQKHLPPRMNVRIEHIPPQAEQLLRDICPDIRPFLVQRGMRLDAQTEYEDQ